MLYIAWILRLQRSRVLVESEHLAATLNSIKQSTRDNATTLEDMHKDLDGHAPPRIL